MVLMYLGIDPGLSGGLALVDIYGRCEYCLGMPGDEAGILMVLREWRSGGAYVRATLEQVHSSPQMGVVSAFTFGRGYGGLRMALTACGIGYDEVTPRKWQQAMQCLSKGDKNITKRRASELFPGVKVTHKVADALLLAEYGRRVDRRFNGEAEGV